MPLKEKAEAQAQHTRPEGEGGGISSSTLVPAEGGKKNESDYALQLAEGREERGGGEITPFSFIMSRT